MSKSNKVIGIDLGTGFSAVAVIEGGKAQVIANSEGNRTTPSVVMIKDGERKIGSAAKRQLVMNPKNTISFIKRFMGVPFDDKDAQETMKHVTYEVINDNDKPRVKIEDRTFSPEEISSYILTAMKKVADDYYGEDVTDAVITCPAWYANAQREAVKVAGELAGLNVLRVINEPTAAILSSNIDTKEDKLVLVADVGCGTCDFSLCDITNTDGEQMIEVLASHGDVFLGGQDYDNAIVDYLAEEFAKEHDGFDLKKDQMAYSRLVEAAEKAKCELSTTNQTEINLPYITVIDNVPQMFVTSLTRAKFEQLTDHLNQRVLECAKECLNKAGKNAEEINDLLLIGGSTRIPAMQQVLSDSLHIKLDKSANPDEAVALGAAIQANIITGGEGSQNVLLLDVTPITLGIETMGGVMTKLVEANTTIPVSRTQVFSTAVDNQPSVDIVVLQGERPMAVDNKIIGRFGLDGIAPAPRGVPQIEVTFEIDANGIVNVKAKDKGTGKEQQITIKDSNNLSQEEIDRIKAEAEKYAEEDKKKSEEIEKINQAESFNFSVKKLLDDEKMKKYATEDDKTKLTELLEKHENAIKERKLDEIESVQKEIEKIWTPIVTKMYTAGQSENQTQNPFQNMTDNPFNKNDFNFAEGMNNMYDSSKKKDGGPTEVPYEEVK